MAGPWEKFQSPEKSAEPSGPWQKFQQEAPASEEEGFDWNSPVYSTLKGSAKIGLKGLENVGQFIDKYSGGPTRAGLLAGIKGENPLTAAKEQFGEENAPTGEQIVGELGMEPGIARKALGFGVDVLADPLNVIPVSKISGLGKAAGLIEKTPEALKVLSEGKAIKQAGGMLKDFRKLMGKGKAADVGQTLLRETVDLADEAGKVSTEPLMKAGDTVENIAEKASILKKQTGERIGQIYKDIDSKVTDPEFLKSLEPKEIKKIQEAERFDPKEAASDLSQMINEKYGKKIDGQKVVSRANEILDQISKRGNSLEDALSLKGELDDMVNYAKQTQELPEIQKALVDIRNFIRDKTNSYVDSVSEILDVADGKELKRLNKLYGNTSEISAMASDKSARNLANRMISPSDYYVGGTGAGVGGVIGGIPGAVIGAGTGLLNKVARERGAGILARGADIGARATEDLAPLAAQGLRSVQEFDKPVLRGLLKKAKRKDSNE